MTDALSLASGHLMPNPEAEYVPLIPSKADEEYLRLREEAVAPSQGAVRTARGRGMALQGERMRDVIEKRVRGWWDADVRFVMLYAGTLALCLLAWAGVACTLPTQPTDQGGGDTNTFSCIGQNACNSGAQPSPDPSTGPAGGCAIAQVGNSLHGTSDQGGIRSANLKVGEQRTLDTTPHQANGQPLGGQCPIAAVTWTNTDEAVCKLNSKLVYTPVVTALKAGTCELRATVGSVTASEPIVISVLP